MKNCLGKKSLEWAGRQKRKKDKTEIAIGVGRRTREATVKWNQVTALRFQAERRHQTLPSNYKQKSDSLFMSL